MNKYVKSFLHRGLIFGGFGPIVVGIVFAIIDATIDGFHLDGWQILLAVASTYLLAFIQAGASVFNQIEHWSLSKSLICHLSTLYVAYVSCYLVNTWIPFKTEIVLIFTAIFVIFYLAVWLTVYLITKAVSKKLNKAL